MVPRRSSTGSAAQECVLTSTACPTPSSANFSKSFALKAYRKPTGRTIKAKCCSRSAECLSWRIASIVSRRRHGGNLKTAYLPSVRCVLLLLALNVCDAASVQKIGPDLYAYISDNDASANSTFLVSGQGILV